MNHFNTTTRCLAAALALGGIAGIVISVSLGAQLAQQSWPVAALMGVFLVVFVWASWTGWQLWQGTPYGRKWAIVAFASQIPVLALPGLSYHWFTGLYLGTIVHLGAGFPAATFAANVGASANFFAGQGASVFWLGINWFAVLAMVLLLRAQKAWRTVPAADAHA